MTKISYEDKVNIYTRIKKWRVTTKNIKRIFNEI